MPFTDVTEGDDWFYDAVAYVYENGIMAGTDETTFEPYMELDRAMAAQLFYNLEGKPAVTGDSTFTDVTSGHWAVDAITWAAQNDIVAGIGGDLYDPDSNVTREQFAVMLYKYARFKGYDLTATGDLTQFPDDGSISSWAETALSWANGKGLINGNEDGTIDPRAAPSVPRRPASWRTSTRTWPNKKAEYTQERLPQGSLSLWDWLHPVKKHGIIPL